MSGYLNGEVRSYRLAALLHSQQLNIEDQRGIRGNHSAGATSAIAKFGRDDQGALAAHLHPGDPLVPASDHLMRPEGELKGLAAIDRAVEFRPLAPLFDSHPV